MKKVLILAYDFPPYVSVGGLRPYSWYKYFKEFGYYPIVVTRQWSNKHSSDIDYISPSEFKETIIEETERGLIIKTPYYPTLSNKIILKYGYRKFAILRKIISGFFEIFQWYFVTGSKVNLYKAADLYIKENNIDLIIATGDPYILFKYASVLSKKYNIPWIADYRDLWLQDKKIQRNWFLKKWITVIENKYVKSASKITTVSKYFADELSDYFDNKKIKIIQNGYDHEIIEKTRDIKQKGDSLNISYVGTIYPYHPIKAFLSVIKDFVSDKKDVKLKINFYGINNEDKIKKIISTQFQKLKDIVIFYPKIPNEKLLSHLSKDNVLLLFNYYSVIGTKIYDYIGLKRLILFCFTNDKQALLLKKRHFLYKNIENFESEQEKLIKETNSGIVVLNTDELRSVIEKLYNNFLETKYVPCESINIEKYSRKIQAKEMINVFEEIDTLKMNLKYKDNTSEKLIKVLILAYDFPPYVSVGSLRPYSWYLFFKEFGIYPILITRQWSNKYGNNLDYIAESQHCNTITEITEYGTIIKTPYKPNLSNKLMLKYGDKKFKILRKIISAYFDIFQWIFYIGPKSQLYFEAKKYLSVNKVDVILATADPFVLFKYAAKLSSKFKIKWIADYRDPWSNNIRNNKRYLYKLYISFFERKIVSKSNFVISVSDFFCKKISQIIENKSFFVLPNGFNPYVIDDIKNIKQSSDKLRIAFIGTIYPWHPIYSFLKVFIEFITVNSNVEIIFYGTNIQNELQTFIVNHNVEKLKFFKFLPKTANEDLLKKIASCNIMLLFNDYSIVGTKIFDYLILRRKILLCYSDDIESNRLKDRYFTIKDEINCSSRQQEDIINKTNSGIIVRDSNHLMVTLNELYMEFIDKGVIECNSINVEEYSRKKQTQRLAKLIKEKI